MSSWHTWHLPGSLASLDGVTHWAQLRKGQRHALPSAAVRPVQTRSSGDVSAQIRPKAPVPVSLVPRKLAQEGQQRPKKRYSLFTQSVHSEAPPREMSQEKHAVSPTQLQD